MDKYIMIAGFAYKRALAYKGKIPVLVIEQIVLIFANVYIWKAVAEYNNSIAGFDSKSLVTYSVVVWLLHRLISNGIDSKIEESFRNGKIVYDLIRPCNMALFYIFDSVGIALFWLVFSVVPTYIFFNYFVGLTMPLGIRHFIISLFSILMSFIILSLLNFIVGMMVFFMEQTKGLRIIKHISLDIFSGLLIPVSFYPLWLQSILDYLPFKYIFYTTIKIWVGSIKSQEILTFLFGQSLWIILLSIISYGCIKMCDKHISIQGG